MNIAVIWFYVEDPSGALIPCYRLYASSKVIVKIRAEIELRQNMRPVLVFLPKNALQEFVSSLTVPIE